MFKQNFSFLFIFAERETTFNELTPHSQLLDLKFMQRVFRLTPHRTREFMLLFFPYIKRGKNLHGSDCKWFVYMFPMFSRLWREKCEGAENFQSVQQRFNVRNSTATRNTFHEDYQLIKFDARERARRVLVQLLELERSRKLAFDSKQRHGKFPQPFLPLSCLLLE